MREGGGREDVRDGVIGVDIRDLEERVMTQGV